MPLTAMQAARTICESGSWRVTNLGLQKILYISQMLFMGEHQGVRLLDTDFEAWDYGPVSPQVYKRVRMFGADPIQDIFFGVSRPSGALEEGFLRSVCEFLVGKKPAELVAITHWKDGAWAKNYKPGVLGIVIPDKDIVDEYRLRTESRTN